jgi:hypothetical protein
MKCWIINAYRVDTTGTLAKGYTQNRTPFDFVVFAETEEEAKAEFFNDGEHDMCCSLEDIHEAEYWKNRTIKALTQEA